MQHDTQDSAHGQPVNNGTGIVTLAPFISGRIAEVKVTSLSVSKVCSTKTIFFEIKKSRGRNSIDQIMKRVVVKTRFKLMPEG